MLLISVDGGTTNTRLVLIRDGQILSGLRLKFGLRDRLSGEGPSYGETLSGGIHRLLDENGIPESGVAGVAVSGMICSERGLREVPHLPAPVGVRELAAAVVRAKFPDIAGIPFFLIPGVKTSAEDGLSEIDVMRGEETELFGITSKAGLRGDFSMILPGSHCKIIPVDPDGKIRVFTTMLSGELIRASAEHTILREGIGDAYPSEIDSEKLLAGFDYSREHGLTEALFKVRMLQKFKGYSPEELFCFLCGAVLSEDMRAIERNARGKIYVGGSEPFRTAYATLLLERTGLEAEEVPEQTARYAAAYGAEALIGEMMK